MIIFLGSRRGHQLSEAVVEWSQYNWLLLNHFQSEGIENSQPWR